MAALQDLDQVDNDYLDALARNDPSITCIEVSPNHGCNDYTKALVANTHIRMINVDFMDYYHHGDGHMDDLQEQATMGSPWQAFCKAASGLASLRTVTVLISKNAITNDDIKLICLLLLYTQQVQEIEVSCTNGIIQDDTAYSFLATSIRMHPRLNSFKLEGFSCQQQEQSLVPLWKALATVPNLESLFFSPTCTSGNENEFDARPVIDPCYLEQLLLNCSRMRRIVFALCKLDGRHSRAIATELSSPLSKLGHLEFWRCELAALKTMLCPLDKNQALQCLVLSDNTISDYDPENNVDVLAPLASNLGLKSLNISILEEADWPRFGFLSENQKLEKLLFESRSESTESVTSLIQSLEHNDALGSLELSCQAMYAKANRHLAPLALNRGLKQLELRNNRPRPAADGVNQSVWPNFDFLKKNRNLEHLTLEAWRGAPRFDQGFESLCTALCTNTTLTTLDMSRCAVQTEHIVALNGMIGQNSGLQKIDLSGGYISGPGHLKLLPGLAQNRTLQVLLLTPYSRLATRIQSTCEDVAEFVQGVLKSESQLKSLEVGPCSAKHLEPLIPVMAANYRMEHLVFHQSYGFTGRNKGTESDETKVLQKRINTITKLNKAGRKYLVGRGSSIGCQAGEEGPGAHSGVEAAGVNVLAKVNQDVDCLFYHLRENPSLCNNKRQSPHQETVPDQHVNLQDRPALSEIKCNNPHLHPQRAGASTMATTIPELFQAHRCLIDHVDDALCENQSFIWLAEMFALSTREMRVAAQKRVRAQIETTGVESEDHWHVTNNEVIATTRPCHAKKRPG